MDYIAGLRKNYHAGALDRSSVHPDPFVQFKIWFDQALSSEIVEPNAVNLSTCGKDMKPSSRIVLLKGFNEKGFIFYTNYNSRKAQQLAENPQAALCFLWKEIERQLRIEGRVSKISKKASDAYFNSRPEASRIGAIASPQSQIVPSRKMLVDRVEEVKSSGTGKNPLIGVVIYSILSEWNSGRGGPTDYMTESLMKGLKRKLYGKLIDWHLKSLS